MLYGTGLTDADLQKPQVGICSMWYEGNTCNMHLDRLAAHVKEGVQAAGLVGLRFNTIGVSDGISMGTDGHELFAAVARPHRRFDRDRDGRAVVRRGHHRSRLRQEHARVSVMAMVRLNRPVDHGVRRHDPRRASRRASRATSSRRSSPTASISPASITDEQRLDIVTHACPGAGACGGMYTANTMATAIEALGLSLPYSSSTPGRGSRQGATNASARARRSVLLLEQRSEAARHRDAEVVRERD